MDDLILAVFESDEDLRSVVLSTLGRLLSEYHRWNTGGEFRPLFVSLTDSAQQVCGGVIAYTHGMWLNLEFVWVAEQSRRKGHGTAMLSVAETEASARGCTDAYLDTACSPEAGFFLARGYRVCGEMTGYVDGRSRYWLRKSLQRS